VLVRTAYTCFLLGFSTLVPPVLPVFNRAPPLVRTGLIVGGRGVLIPKHVFRSIGLFDEKELPHYGADNDFYIRCKSSGYRLYISTQAIVEVDNRQTTRASAIGRQSFSQFFSTLRQRNSHRNISDQMKLFRKHYPIPGLYPLGVLLNLMRYAAVYFILRARYMIARY
jgi:GT2 family glycosyltransferase